MKQQKSPTLIDDGKRVLSQQMAVNGLTLSMRMLDRIIRGRSQSCLSVSKWQFWYDWIQITSDKRRSFEWQVDTRGEKNRL